MALNLNTVDGAEGKAAGGLEEQMPESFYADAVGAANASIVITDPRHPDNPIIYCNAAFVQLTGYSAAETQGRNCRFLQGDATDPEAVRVIREHLRDESPCQIEILNYKKDGTPFWNHLHIAPVRDEGGNLLYFVGVQNDITARKDAQKNLADSEARSQALLANISEIVSILDSHGVAQYESASLERVLGYRPEELIGTNVCKNIHPEDLSGVIAEFSTGLGRRGEFRSVQYRFLHQNGTWRWMESIGSNQLHQPGIGGIVVTTRDITERKQAEETISWQAFYDSLTELPNRTLFYDRAEKALAAAARHGQQVAILFLDLDDFKRINDSLGHAAGDLLLREMGERLRKCLRDEDTLARLGGDEFGILLPDLERTEDAALIASRILEAVARPVAVDHHDLPVTTSVGISIFPADGNRIGELLRNADTAMYQAKSAGRNTFRHYAAAMNIAAMERLMLERDLRRALELNEMIVHYQPQSLLRTERIIGVEALLRWRHPTLGLVPPARFIPLAEETGLILTLGEWVLREACRQAKEWRAAGHSLRVSVNVSPRQLQRQNLPDVVAAVLRETDLSKDCLELEVTESGLALASGDEVTATLRQLRELGVSLSVDDFGTGYSSLSRLREFPLNALKIDRSFVQDLGAAPQSQVLVRALFNWPTRSNSTSSPRAWKPGSSKRCFGNSAARRCRDTC